MKTQRNPVWIMVLLSCLFSISCGTVTGKNVADGMVAAGEGMMEGSATAMEQKPNAVSPITWIIGGFVTLIGAVAGGKSHRPPRPDAPPDDPFVDTSSAALVEENAPPPDQPTIDDTSIAVEPELPPVAYPAASSSITQTSTENIGYPQVNEVANANHDVIPRGSRDPRRGTNQNRPNTARASARASANANAGNTSSRAQGAGGSLSYTQPNQQPQTGRGSVSANANAGNTASRAQGAGGSLSLYAAKAADAKSR